MAKINLGTLTADGVTTPILTKEIDSFEKPIMFFIEGQFGSVGASPNVEVEWSSSFNGEFKPFRNGDDIVINPLTEIDMRYILRIPSDIFVRMAGLGLGLGPPTSPNITGFLA